MTVIFGWRGGGGGVLRNNLQTREKNGIVKPFMHLQIAVERNCNLRRYVGERSGGLGSFREKVLAATLRSFFTVRILLQNN